MQKKKPNAHKIYIFYPVLGSYSISTIKRKEKYLSMLSLHGDFFYSFIKQENWMLKAIFFWGKYQISVVISKYALRLD